MYEFVGVSTRFAVSNTITLSHSRPDFLHWFSGTVTALNYDGVIRQPVVGDFAGNTLA